MKNYIVKVGYPHNQHISPLTDSKDIEQLSWSNSDPILKNLKLLKLPICMRCNKEVETMRIIEEDNFYKLTVNCHGGHEEIRFDKPEFVSIISNKQNLEQPGISFGSSSDSSGILPRNMLGKCQGNMKYSLKEETIQVGVVNKDLIFVDKERDNSEELLSLLNNLSFDEQMKLKHFIVNELK